jgi:hypothetical protein
MIDGARASEHPVTHLFDRFGFLGAWLLVAGPLAQATRELQEEEIERDDLDRAAAVLPKPPPVPGWWLLLPPAYYWLHRRRQRAYRRAVIEALPSDKAQAFLRLREKADAWFFVAAGAALIALQQTWTVRAAYRWPAVAFWLLTALMALVCVANTVAQVRRRKVG